MSTLDRAVLAQVRAGMRQHLQLYPKLELYRYNGVTPYYIATMLGRRVSEVCDALERLKQQGEVVNVRIGPRGFGWVQPVAMPTVRRLNVD